MLHLKTERGERLELPATAVIAVMKASDGSSPSTLVYDLGYGPQIDRLSDQYGFVRKLVLDAQALVNPIEIRVLEADRQEGRMTFSRERIIARREVHEHPEGANTILVVDLTGNPVRINVMETLDELDGTTND